jgi:hypothetical protein
MLARQRYVDDMETPQNVIRDGLATIISNVDPGLGSRLESDPAAHLRLISIAAEIGDEANATLRAAVESARTAGLSWEQIGEVVHISRQAAQQRFGLPTPAPQDQVWRMKPVTSFDEMERLNEAGKHGWHSIGFGTLYHDLARTDEQWEHRRVSMFTARAELEADGWQKIGALWFPWAYYARPLGIPALP